MVQMLCTSHWMACMWFWIGGKPKEGEWSWRIVRVIEDMGGDADTSVPPNATLAAGLLDRDLPRMWKK